MAHSTKVIENEDLHILGVVSLYIAIKYEHDDCFSASQCSEYISNFKFSNKEISAIERLILNTINFKLNFSTAYDFICHSITEVAQGQKYEKKAKLIKSTALF